MFQNFDIFEQQSRSEFYFLCNRGNWNDQNNVCDERRQSFSVCEDLLNSSSNTFIYAATQLLLFLFLFLSAFVPFRFHSSYLFPRTLSTMLFIYRRCRCRVTAIHVLKHQPPSLALVAQKQFWKTLFVPILSMFRFTAFCSMYFFTSLNINAFFR